MCQEIHSKVVKRGSHWGQDIGCIGFNEKANIFTATKVVQSSPKLAWIIRWILHFLNGSSVMANQIEQLSRQIGSQVISQQLFDALTPNLLFVVNPILKISIKFFVSFDLLGILAFIAACSNICSMVL